MAAAPDPFAPHLKRADDLFAAGDIVQAGQIWQAILKKMPGHEAARAGLYKVKLCFDARATQGGLSGRPAAPGVRETQERPLPDRDPQIVRLLEQGCTLYDAGHAEEALVKWNQVLAKDPDNALAKGYILGVQRSRGQEIAIGEPAPPDARTPDARTPEIRPPEVDVERLLRDGCTLFDMGQTEDALKKWEQILAHDPGHALARAYAQDARKDLGLPPLAEGERPAAVLSLPETGEPRASLDEEGVAGLIREGVQLYDMGMIQEAVRKWQRVLEQVPGHKDAEAYLAMAQREPETPVRTPPPAASPTPLPPRPQRVALTPQPRVELVLEPLPEPETPAPVSPPSAVTSGAPQVRKGLNLPELLRGLSLPAWTGTPAFILGLIASLVVLVVGSFYYLQHRKDKALKAAVAAFRVSATSPVAKDSEIKEIRQTPAEIRKEAESALGEDPLLAYLRARECLRLDPGDAAAAQLLDRAKAEMAQEAGTPGTVDDFDKQMRAHDLETADRTLTALLDRSPDDPVLKEKAARLYRHLVPAYASKERWTEAEARLRRGRAMFPEDRSWSARLLLLERIQEMSGQDRSAWIQMLG